VNTSAEDPHVLVTFYSRGGLTERLAVLIAEGAIQGGASIRLRRARDLAPEDVVARVPGWKESRDRMHAEYAEPRLADVEWAHVIAFGTPALPGGLSPELGAFLDQIKVAKELSKDEIRFASAFSSTYRPDSEWTRRQLEIELLDINYVVAPPPADRSPDDYERARAHGRWLARLAAPGRRSESR
jgi:multimeric flavodoxin WrbA